MFPLNVKYSVYDTVLPYVTASRDRELSLHKILPLRHINVLTVFYECHAPDCQELT